MSVDERLENIERRLRSNGGWTYQIITWILSLAALLFAVGVYANQVRTNSSDIHTIETKIETIIQNETNIGNMSDRLDDLVEEHRALRELIEERLR